ncbi:hypothetical protein KR222_000455 [Zaprionus bogoriensis]|nr:hypothetical protein KR222_000455 [Zaprionus bogoriensis]
MKNIEGEEEQRQRSYEDFTYIPNIILKSLGVDLLNTPKPLWQVLLLRLYFCICCASHVYLVYFLVLRTIEWDTLAGNPTAIMRYGIVYFFVLNSDVKFIIFLYHRRRLRSLNDKLRDLYPRKQYERREYRVNEFYWQRVARYGFYYYYFVVAFVVLGPLMQTIGLYIYQRCTVGESAEVSYLSTYPMVRIRDMTPLTYAFTVLVDSTFSHFIMNVNLGTDVWMMCHSGQLCMHFAHLGRQLERYSPDRNRQREDCAFLGRLVRRHQYLFSLHTELNDIFGIMLAYNMFSTATVLCCVVLYSVLQGLNREGIGFLLFFISSSAQFFMVSQYGQLLSDVSERVSLSAYTQPWYNGSISYRKCLLLIMQRAERQAELSAKGVIIISLDNFTKMINMTYRFFAVVRRLMEKKA